MQLTLDELKGEKDIVVESQDIKIVYEPHIEEYVKNSIVDYSNSWFNRGFIIKGSNMSSC